MAGIKLEETCIMCPRRGSKRCGVCKKAQYCSKECQVLDFKNHKLLCSSINEPPPGDNFRRVLLFPGGEEPPRFHWMAVKKIQGQLATFETLDFQSIFGAATPVMDGMPDLPPVDGSFTFRSNIQNRDMFRHDRERLLTFCKDNANYLPTNQAVRKFTRAGVCGFSWGGPVVVARSQFTPISDDFDDMELLDARHAADHFASANRTLRTRPENVYVLGCSIAPSDDIKKGMPKYYEFVFGGCDAVFIGGGSGITNLFGIPLLIRKAPAPDASESAKEIRGGNDEASLLKRDIVSVTYTAQSALVATPNSQQSKTSYFRTLGVEMPLFASFCDHPMAHGGAKQEQLPGFGKTPMEWEENSVGRIVVVRADGKPLIKPHLEVICQYIKQKVEPAIQAATEGLSPGSIVETREQVLNAITKANFLEFFKDYKKSKSATEPEWRYLPSPYEIDSVGMTDTELAMRAEKQKARRAKRSTK